MIVRSAKPDDLDTLCSMAERFVSETNLPLTYDATLTRQTLWSAIQGAENIILVAESNGVLGGVVLGCVDRDFCEEAVGFIGKFYVEGEFRGLGVSRELISGFQQAAKERGASVIFTAATAGMGDQVEALYVKLFESAGYSVLGRVLVKEVRDE